MCVSAITTNPDICNHVDLSVFYCFLLIHISALCLGSCFSCLFVQYNLKSDVIHSGLFWTLWDFLCFHMNLDFFKKNSCKECYGNLSRDWICELHSAMIFFSIWILPIHAHGIPFYLLVHFISFFSGLKFQLKRSVLANFMSPWPFHLCDLTACQHLFTVLTVLEMALSVQQLPGKPLWNLFWCHAEMWGLA